MDLQTNEILRLKVDAIVAFAVNLKRGDTLHHFDIEHVTGEQRYQGLWQQIIVAMKKRILRERGIALRAEPEIGYKFLTKEEQLTRCPKDRRERMIRQSNKAIAELRGLDGEELTMHQRTMKARVEQGLIHERRAIKRGKRDQVQFIKESEVLPKRPITGER